MNVKIKLSTVFTWVQPCYEGVKKLWYKSMKICVILTQMRTVTT